MAITLTDQRKSMNAINGEFTSELDKLICEMAKDEEIVTVIITGSERFFARVQTLKRLIELGQRLIAEK